MNPEPETITDKEIAILDKLLYTPLWDDEDLIALSEDFPEDE